jgi:hypothetical protein
LRSSVKVPKEVSKRESLRSSIRSSVKVPKEVSKRESLRSSVKVPKKAFKKDSLRSSSNQVNIIYINYNKKHSSDIDLTQIKKTVKDDKYKIITQTLFNKSRFSSLNSLLRGSYDKNLKTLNDIKKFLLKKENTQNYEFFIKIKDKNGNYIYYNIDSITEELLRNSVLVDNDDNEISFNNLSSKAIFYLDKRDSYF